MANTADTLAAGKIVEVTFTGTGADWNYSTDGGFSDFMYVKSIIWHPSGADDVLVVNEGGVDGPSIVHWKAYADFVPNGSFTANTTGWTAVDCTLDSVSGGQAGNCLEITRTGGANQYAYDGMSLTVGTVYTCAGYIKSGTSGNEAYRIATGDFALDINGTSSSAWVKFSQRFKAETAAVNLILYKNTATAGTMLFDTVTLNDLPLNKQINFGDRGVPLKPYIDISDCTFSDITATKIIFILE